MTPFQPKGETAQWRTVYDMLCRLDIGDQLSYDDLCAALDIDDHARVRGPVRKAAAVWGKEHHRALIPVTGEGYRVAEPTEHELIARKHHRKSRRALGRSQAAIQNADRSLLSPADRTRFDQMEAQLARHADLIRRLDLRQAADRAALRATDEKVAQTDEKVARLEDALRRHGIDVEGS